MCPASFPCLAWNSMMGFIKSTVYIYISRTFFFKCFNKLNLQRLKVLTL